jgi:hypothetical protein
MLLNNHFVNFGQAKLTAFKSWVLELLESTWLEVRAVKIILIYLFIFAYSTSLLLNLFSFASLSSASMMPLIS